MALDLRASSSGDNAFADLDAEAAVLGAVVLSSRALPTLIVDEGLTVEDFYREQHRHIYGAMLAIHDTGDPLDALTIARRAGVDYGVVDALGAATPGIGTVRRHAALVKRAALRRRWHQAATLLEEAVRTDDEKLVAQAESQLAAPTVSEDSYDPGRLAGAVFDYLSVSGPTGLSTGFSELDEIIGGGLRPGDTTVLAAWESMGKSALADMWLALAARTGLRVHAYINEMSPADRALRMLARQGAAPWWRLVRRDLRDADAVRVKNALSEIPFGVTDCSVWTVEQIARHMRVHRWDLCALDVLHNIPYQRESELHQIVATLAAAARSTGTHLILVCHLNQERAKDDTLPRPVLRDLRGSGMIAKLAANVLFLHRDQHRNEEGFVETEAEGVLVADKARHGRRGEGVEVVFEPQRMRFRLPDGAAA